MEIKNLSKKKSNKANILDKEELINLLECFPGTKIKTDDGLEIELDNHIIESSYKFFEVGYIININGETVYKEDSMNVGNYENEVVIEGTYKTKEEAIDNILDRIKGSEVEISIYRNRRT